MRYTTFKVAIYKTQRFKFYKHCQQYWIYFHENIFIEEYSHDGNYNFKHKIVSYFIEFDDKAILLSLITKQLFDEDSTTETWADDKSEIIDSYTLLLYFSLLIPISVV